MPVSLVSAVRCLTRDVSAWRAEDYAAYKVVRVLGGRRIAGSVWLPQEAGPARRISNAQRDVAVAWFVRRVEPHLERYREYGRRAALVPYPDPERVVGGPPSRSRMLAQALADANGLRVLDILRWRQVMPRCRESDVQSLADNLLTTGAPMQLECILVADCVRGEGGIQAAAAKLRRSGAQVALAVSAGRAVRVAEACPFSTQVVELDDVPTVDLF